MALTMNLENLQQENQNKNNDQNNGQYDRGNKNDSTIKFEKVIKPNLVITRMHIFL